MLPRCVLITSWTVLDYFSANFRRRRRRRRRVDPVVGMVVGMVVGAVVGDPVVGMVVGAVVGDPVVGMVVGMVVGDPVVGMVVGMVVGAVVGAVVKLNDAPAPSKRSLLTARRNSESASSINIRLVHNMVPPILHSSAGHGFPPFPFPAIHSGDSPFDFDVQSGHISFLSAAGFISTYPVTSSVLAASVACVTWKK